MTARRVLFRDNEDSWMPSEWRGVKHRCVGRIRRGVWSADVTARDPKRRIARARTDTSSRSREVAPLRSRPGARR